MNKIIKKLLVISFICFCVNTSHAENVIAGSVYEKIGHQENVDPLLLYAVSLTESAMGKNKSVAPSTFAIRTPEGAIYPKNLHNAKVALKKAIQKYGHRGIDVGLMQINGQHWVNMKNKNFLFNPTFNVRFGARILKKAMNTTSNRTLGIGRYHSFTEWRAKTYASRVLAVYNNLKNID